jgi:hypothetical protein
MSNATVAIETITPSQASAWLKNRFEGQRNVREPHVQRLAAMIAKGDWRLTCDAVTLIKGKLGNGQHRCEAIVLSGKPCDALVLRTSDEKLFDVMDSGITRTVSDVMSQHGAAAAMTISSASRTALAYERGLITRMKIGAARNRPNSQIQDIITRQDVIDYCTEHQEKLASYAKVVAKLYAEAAILAPSLAVAFLKIAGEKNEKKALEFIKTIYTGDVRNAASDIRDRLIKNRLSNKKIASSYLFGILIKGFKAYTEDRRPELYRIGAKEEYPVL